MPDGPPTGRFITFEGGEGVGKSTQVRRLKARLEALGHTVETTREPGGSPRAEALRETLLSGAAKRFGALAETLLVASARADHMDRRIRPALERGAVVICDRFVDSTRAYQGALGGVDSQAIGGLERVATGGRMPDLTLILDAAPADGLARARRRAGAGAAADRFEAEDAGFHETLRAAFVRIARLEPDRCALIDASGSEGLVEDRIWETVARRLMLDRAADGTAAS